MHALENLPYVVATSQIAEELNKLHPHGLITVNQLIDQTAIAIPNQIAVGMPQRTADGTWHNDTISA